MVVKVRHGHIALGDATSPDAGTQYLNCGASRGVGFAPIEPEKAVAAEPVAERDGGLSMSSSHSFGVQRVEHLLAQGAQQRMLETRRGQNQIGGIHELSGSCSRLSAPPP